MRFDLPHLWFSFFTDSVYHLTACVDLQAGDLLDVLILRLVLALGLSSIALAALPVAILPYAAAAAVVCAAPLPDTVCALELAMSIPGWISSC